MTTKNIFIFLTTLLTLTACDKSTQGFIINNSDDTLIISGFYNRDTILPPKGSIDISTPPPIEAHFHKFKCCPCELINEDAIIKPLNKARKLTKNIRNEIECKKIPADKHTPVNCKFIIYQHDIIN